MVLLLLVVQYISVPVSTVRSWRCDHCCFTNIHLVPKNLRKEWTDFRILVLSNGTRPCMKDIYNEPPAVVDPIDLLHRYPAKTEELIARGYR